MFSTFHYTGKLNNFDKVVYWGNVAAGIFAPTIFLHFCLTFPDLARMAARTWAGSAYLPARNHSAGSDSRDRRRKSSRWTSVLSRLRWLLDRALMAYLSFMYLLGAVVLNLEYLRTEDPILRQQLKWLRNGAVLGIVPFTAIYVLPYVIGFSPASYMNWAVLFLPVIPITWAYAIVRYRLMDVDVIFQQGYVYTLSTVAVLGVFYAFVLHDGTGERISARARLSP